MRKSERKRLKKLKKPKLRVPIAPPGKRHKTKKDYKRRKRVESNET